MWISPMEARSTPDGGPMEARWSFCFPLVFLLFSLDTHTGTNRGRLIATVRL